MKKVYEITIDMEKLNELGPIKVLWIASENPIRLATNSFALSVRETGVLPDEEGIDLIIELPAVNKPKVCIENAGSIIQNIVSEIDLDITLIDYDHLGEEKANANICGNPAYVNLKFPVEVNPKWVQELHRQGAKEFDDMQTIKMIVAGHNANGEPDLFFCEVDCTKEQYNNGEHYEIAMHSATEEGYEPKIAYDTNDSAGKELAKLYWGKESPFWKLQEEKNHLQLCKEALADLEGIMPEFEPSGERTHPAWETIDRLKTVIEGEGAI